MKSSRTRRPLNHNSVEQTEKSPFFSSGHEEAKKKDDAFFQTKLAVGEKDDKHEKEANAVADKVQKKEEEKDKPKVQKKEDEKKEPATHKMDKKEEEKPIQKMSGTDKKEEKKEPAIPKMDKKEEEKPIQKMSDADKKEDKKVQKKEAGGNEKEEHIMKAAKNDAPAHAAHKPSLEERIRQSKGKGFALPEDIRTSLEGELGGDFSSVVIHTDNEAIEMNEELHSVAFTNGFDVYFSAQQYQPGTMEGKKLLAHELTHVLQQTGATRQRHGQKK